ncbi:MAG: PEP-CTERM sorting domain-containing protein, partial [Planctomycetota bacterium]|nr:PEP-CTERM sorting domain-containing protein [Planctomycetota bacterium]
WLRDNTNAWNWGERLVSNPDVKPKATAASGWQWEVTSMEDLGWGTGWLVEWWTDETDNLINLANDLDPFSFSVDVREITAAGQTYADDGTDIALGTKWDLWFGSYTGIFNDDSTYAAWTDTGGWEGTLELTAVPEPLTMLAVFTGIAGLAGYVRKRKMA